MVKFRGIEISIISQFDIRKLPEYRFCQTSPSPDRHPLSPKATASCFVPIYPGSQIWFEYNIDGPHPPSAAYLFKLLFNGRTVTSFDCGARHSYHGMMMYNLVARGRDEMTGRVRIVRQALHFSSGSEHRASSPPQDVIEFRVHRIEHRKRIRELEDGVGAVENMIPDARLQLADGGILEPSFPRRRYKYQLLDPADEPYATFKFFCRPHEYLQQHRIIDPAVQSPSSSLYSTENHECRFNPENGNNTSERIPTVRSLPLSSPPKFSIKMVASPPELSDMSTGSGSQGTLDKHNSMASDTYLPPSDSDEDLSIITKDSIEDLPSTVPRSPKSPRLQAFGDDDGESHTLNASASIEKSPQSPRRRLKKSLMVNLNGAGVDLELKKRALSPFTSGGMLRKDVTPSTPAAVTGFSPSIHDEIESGSEDENQSISSQSENSMKTTRTERSGRSLMEFLTRRMTTK